MSMAAGEYVSVSSQTDAENADLARERRELAETPEAELEELTRIYVDRGLDRRLAEQVATQLTERHALGAHARDELGISEAVAARPVQAAVVSALTFAAGAVVPVLVALASPAGRTSVLVAGTTVVALAILGGLGATAGGASVMRGAVRVTFWGALAMGVTAAVGAIFGVSVA
jgi:VIT1/CCC1 family predicted Fe2+/Mn2+ transporter